MQKRLLFLVALMLTFSLTLMAQITTSSMAGKVARKSSVLQLWLYTSPLVLVTQQ